MNRARLLSLCAVFLLAGSSLFAVPTAKWESPEITLGTPKATILKTLGNPDTTDTGTEIYLISDSPELLMGMVEYKNDKVSVYGQIYKPDVTLQRLKEKLKAKGLSPLSENEEATVYFTKMPNSDLEYYIVLSPTNESTTGPGVANMTKEAFTEAEQQEKDEKGNASESAAPEKPQN